MITPELNIRRYSELWGGVTPETVKRYREELEQMQKDIQDYTHERILFVSPKLVSSLSSAIGEEIKYCLFYDEYLERLSDSKLGQWVFRKQEDIPDLYGWKKAPGEQWVKTNGRIKAVIQFDRTGIMVKITLEYDNDSKNLKFYERSYRQHVPTFRLKNENSIEEAVRELKRDADRFLEDRLFPLGSNTDFNTLKELLHIKK